MALTAAGALGTLVVAALGGYAYLTGSSGEARVKAFLLSRANQSLRGRLEATGLELSLRRISLAGLKLYDPDGVLVAEVERVDLALRAASPSEVSLSSARIVRPRLYLRQDSRGLNLARALEAKEAGGAGPSGSPFRLQLDELALEEGFADFVHASAAGERRSTVEELGGKGRASYASGGGELSAALELSGRAQSPLKAPLSLHAEAGGEGAALSAKADLSIAGARLSVAWESRGSELATVTLQALELPPEVARAALPGYPLRLPLTATGSLERKGNLATAALRASAGSARVFAEGSWDIVRWRSAGLKLDAHGINLAELLDGGMESDLRLALFAQGGGTSLKNLEGTLALEVPASQLERQPLGPIRLFASAQGGKVEVSELLAVLPGLRLTGSGSATHEHLRLRGELTAADLARASRALAAVSPGVPSLVGHGALTLEVEGPLRHPGLWVKGELPLLRAEAGTVESLRVDGRLADVRRPLEAQGTLEAKKLRVGDRSFEEVRVALATQGRKLEADFSTKGLSSIVLHAGGTLEPGGEGLGLTELALRYPEARWELESPTRVGWSGGDVELGRVRLRSGRQSISLEGSRKGSRLRADLSVSDLDLRLLPGAFVDSKLELAGLVNVKLHAQGKLPRPKVDAQVEWRDGGFREIRQVHGLVEAAFERDRLQGHLQLRSPLAQVAARFGLPPRELFAGRGDGTVDLTASVRDADLESLSSIAKLLPLKGRADIDLRLGGTSGDPRLEGRVTGRELQASVGSGELSLSSLELSVKSAEDGKLSAKLGAKGYGGTAQLALEAPLTLARLLRLRRAGELLEAPLELTLSASGVELSQLVRTGLLPEEVGGTVALELSARGTAKAPDGTMKLQLTGATAAGVPPADVSLELTAKRSEVRAELSARRGPNRIANLRARLMAPFERLLEPEGLAKAPFTVDGEAGPLSLSELGLRSAEEGTSELAGQAKAVLSAQGTLDEPRVDLRASLERAALGKVALGRADLLYRYGNGKHALDAELRSPDGKLLELDGELELDASYSALRKRPDITKAPVRATLRAKRFELDFLAGIHPKVRALSGLLDADARLQGELWAPAVEGVVEWTDGRIGLLGYGEYRKVHLRLLANNERIQLEDFSARAGAGSVELTGTATRGREGYALSASAEASELPIVYDDQLFAIATLRATLEGEAGAKLLDIRELAIPEAHVELPALRRKDLQDLDRPNDVVLVKNGQPLHQRKRREAPGEKAGIKDESERRYQIVLRAPRNLWVKGADVTAELGLSEGFRVTYQGETSMYGEVHVLRGRAEVIGRKFEVQRDAELRFQGPAKQPYINLTATHVNEREGVTVFVTITGRGKEVSLKPSSQPPLSESEIYTLLATGRRALKRGSGAAMTGEQAASVVGALAASQLKSALAKKLPLDVFSIEAGAEGFKGTKVEAGTYVSDKVYLGYTAQIDADKSKGENSHAGKLEYQISPRWAFEATYGDAHAGGADLVWSRDY